LREKTERDNAIGEALQQARMEKVAMLEEESIREERHRRDIAELEGMLEPVMAESSRLRAALSSAEARLEAVANN